MFALVAIAVLTATVVILWRYGTRPLRILKTCGVPIVPGAMPFFGHTSELLKAEHFGTYDYDNLKKFGKIYGECQMNHPVLVVADPDVLKEVLLKQFNSFMDRSKLPLRGWMKLSMLDQRGAEWKRIRAMATPFFSVAKLKHNVSVMHHPVKSLLQHLRKLYETGNIFDAHSVCSSLTLDVICATAFGLDVDSQNDPNNQLLLTIKQLTNVSLTSPLIILSFIFPFLSPILEFFNITMFPSGYLDYFEKVAKQMIDDRKNTNKTRPDFIQAMVKAHQEDLDYQTRVGMYGEAAASAEDTKRGLTDKEITAQVLLFFLAGYDTTARALSMFLYNMALHPEIQEKLHAEIVAQIGDQVPNYDTIPKLKYLDQCLTESLRLYPPAFRVDREAMEDVTIGGISIPKHTLVSVPIWAIHHDPDLWPSPETFDPDRFSTEKPDHNQFSYLPFGTGLRGCIGSRFAQMELKLAIIEMLRVFKVLKNDRTPMKLTMVNGLFLQPKETLWISIEPRIPKSAIE